MALVTSIFGGATLDRGTSTKAAAEGASPTGFLLNDQEYYDLYIRPKEEELFSAADSTSGALARSSRARQGQFMKAQGLGDSVMSQQMGTSMDASFQKAVRRARQGARMEAEGLRQRGFAERDRVRAQELQKVAQANAVEAAFLTAIPKVGPFLAAGTMAAGAGWQAGLSQTPGNVANLDVYDFGDDQYDEPSLSSRTRGGGGYDLYA
tara:strand:- start:529 stop:1152 length:624 start_codon:yes stop_codon:yes gene_type:complete